MRKVYVRELKPYSLQEIAEIFGTSLEESKRVIDWLMLRGVVRYRNVDASDGADLSDEADARPDELYVFNYVGLAMVGDLVLIAYPKYFRDRKPDDAEIAQLFRVLRNDSGRKTLISLVGSGKRTPDRLPIMLTLLDLYSEYGEYSNYVDDRELNGGGVIDWDRTINGHLPFIKNGRPVYVEYETRKTRRDESDFITRLHRAVLAECSQELGDASIADLLSVDVDGMPLSEEAVSDFGDLGALEWRLGRERGTQFVDWKIATLELLTKYLLSRENDAEEHEIEVLGTNSFYHLWEEACKTALADKLDAKLGRLGIPLADGWEGEGNNTLLGIIPHPEWERWSNGAYGRAEGADTLIPDTVSLVDNGGKKVFCIYDAKYYVPSLSGKMKKQPGLESVTKQFLYQSAYRPFVEDHDFTAVVNAFLVPTCDDEPRKLARVSFPKVMGEVKPPFSNYIVMWALPAHKVFDAYLRGARIDGGLLRTVWESEV